MKEKMQEFQEGLAWQLEEGESITIGATQSALDQAGALQQIEIADEGEEYEEGDWIGELRGKDSVVEILAPCRLKVSERNNEIVETPSILEDDPTGDAWMIRVERLE